MSIETIIERQKDIADGKSVNLNLPRFSKYAVCNLRGGCGKTTITFNLSYLAGEVLSVDVCPQGNLSYFYDQDYFNQRQNTTFDLIMSHILPGLSGASNSSLFAGATNKSFKGKRVFYIPSSENLYTLASSLYQGISMVSLLPNEIRDARMRDILNSLNIEVDKEMKANDLKRCLFDTSPFLSGGTELALYASDALIVPVRTDQQSIKSLELLIQSLSSSDSPAVRYREYVKSPKIQLVILTHCGWSTRAGAINKPNQQTKLYLKKVYDIISRRIQVLTTSTPDDHIIMLDDLLGTGRISSALAQPVELLNVNQVKYIDRVKVCVNSSVEKCKSQFKFINDQIW